MWSAQGLLKTRHAACQSMESSLLHGVTARGCGYCDGSSSNAEHRPQPLRLELAPSPDGEPGQRHCPVRGDAGEQGVGVATAGEAQVLAEERRPEVVTAVPDRPRASLAVRAATARCPVNRPRSSAGSARHTVSKSTTLVVGPSKRTWEGSNSPWATPIGPGGSTASSPTAPR